MKKKEFIFIGGILILALAMWGEMSLINKGSHGSIRITVDGEEYGTYSLERDQTIKINDTNVCEIKDGQARMISAQCPDHLCMKQKAIVSIRCFEINAIILKCVSAGKISF